MRWNFGPPPQNVILLCKVRSPYTDRIGPLLGVCEGDVIETSLTYRCSIDRIICWERYETIEKELESNID